MYLCGYCDYRYRDDGHYNRASGTRYCRVSYHHNDSSRTSDSSIFCYYNPSKSLQPCQSFPSPHSPSSCPLPSWPLPSSSLVVTGTKTVPTTGSPGAIQSLPSAPTPTTGEIPERPGFEELINGILNNTIDIGGRKVPTWLIGTGGLLGITALAAIAASASDSK